MQAINSQDVPLFPVICDVFLFLFFFLLAYGYLCLHPWLLLLHKSNTEQTNDPQQTYVFVCLSNIVFYTAHCIVNIIQM